MRFPEGLEQTTFRELGIEVDVVDATLAEPVTRACRCVLAGANCSNGAGASPCASRRVCRSPYARPARGAPVSRASPRPSSGAGECAPRLAAHRRIDDPRRARARHQRNLASLDTGERRDWPSSTPCSYASKPAAPPRIYCMWDVANACFPASTPTFPEATLTHPEHQARRAPF